jgi:hypothetical protein
MLNNAQWFAGFNIRIIDCILPSGALALELALALYLDHKHGAVGSDGRSLGLGQVVRGEMQRGDSDRLLLER